MGNTIDATHTSRLIEHIFGFGSGDLPPSAFEAAKILLLDTLGRALVGRRAPGVEAVIEQMCDWGGKPEAGIQFSDAPKLPMPNAAFANSAMIHALDLDDIFTPGTLHLTSVIVPVMLAAAEVCEANGRDLLAAMILGIEMAARIGVAEHSRRRSGGFLPSSLAGSFGAVVTAARLLGLTPGQAEQAMGINYAQISGNRQSLLDASLTKRLQPAFAVRSALWSTALAARGLTGPQRVFEGEAGYFKVYMNSDVPALGELLKPFDGFAVEHVSTKRYPSCGACHSVQIAAERLREEEILAPADIARVETFGIAPLVSEPFELKDNPQVAAQFSGAWAVAHTLLRGPAKLADHTDDAVRIARERRIKPWEMTGTLFDEAARVTDDAEPHLTDEEVRQCMSLDNFFAKHHGPGDPHPDETRCLAALRRQRLGDLRTSQKQRRRQLAEADQRLQAAMREIVAS